MTLYIGDIPIHYVSSFNVDRGLKNIEEVHFIGSNVVPYLAEHNSKLLDLEISGTLLAESGISATLDDLAERILAIKDRGACFNFIHNFQSRSGWAGLKEGVSDKNAHSLVTRPFNMEGKFLPKNSYQSRMHSHPIILTNDFSLSLGANGCDNYIPIPIGATYSGGDGSIITRIGKDGTTTLVKANTNNDIKWDLDADEVDVGECKVWDDMNEASESDWVRVFNPDHVFTGDCFIENGLIRFKDIDKVNPAPYLYNSVGAVWEQISSNLYLDLLVKSFRISELTSDKIVLKREVYTSIISSETETLILTRGSPLLSLEYTDGDVTTMSLSNLIYDSRFGYSNGEISDNVLSVGSVNSQTSELIMAIGTTNTILISTAVGGITYEMAGLLRIGYQSLTAGEKVFLGGIKAAYVANLFQECEDMTQGAGVAFYTGVDASPKTGNTGSILNAQNEQIDYSLTGGTDLPLGIYKLFIRAKDSAQVANDLAMYINNITDSTQIMAPTSKTLTGSWAYYAFDVTLASDDDGDEVKIFIYKQYATANTIDLDYILWVPISLDNGNGPQDIAHQAMVDQRMQRELVQR